MTAFLRQRNANIPRETLYRIVDTQENPLALYLLGIRNSEIDTWCRLAGVNACHVTTNLITCSLVRRLFKDLLYEEMMKRPAWELLMLSLVMEMLGVLHRSRSEKTEPEKVNRERQSVSRARVTGYIQELSEHFYRHQTLEQAASSTGLHIRRFSILFREITGISWLAFLQNKRIQYAKKLLSETNRSITSICFECGFDELSTFYRWFKQHEKTSPKKWRELAAKIYTRVQK